MYSSESNLNQKSLGHKCFFFLIYLIIGCFPFVSIFLCHAFYLMTEEKLQVQQAKIIVGSSILFMMKNFDILKMRIKKRIYTTAL